MDYNYDLISVERDAGVGFATIDNPPINLMTLSLLAELSRLAEEIEADDAVRVLVLRSANPDFFIAHFDVEAILQIRTQTELQQREAINDFHRMCERYRTLSTVTIAQLEGRVGGGGSELSAALDMRFGVRRRTIINQMEVPLGILPGGGGTQRLPRLLGRGRALEVILGADDLDAESAELWGYLNRALGSDEIGSFVERLARRIASFPPQAVAAAKAAVDCAAKPLEAGLIDEARLLQTVLRTEEARVNILRFLKLGGQSREGELRMGDLCGELGG